INIFKADVLATLFVGAMIPVVFSALAMKSVGKAAMEMVQEVRRQFRDIPGILEGTGTPQYGKCVEISTKAAYCGVPVPSNIPGISEGTGTPQYAALVDISTHFPYCGVPVPSNIPGISLNCLRTS